jgi:hypothetical protein
MHTKFTHSCHQSALISVSLLTFDSCSRDLAKISNRRFPIVQVVLHQLTPSSTDMGHRPVIKFSKPRIYKANGFSGLKTRHGSVFLVLALYSTYTRQFITSNHDQKHLILTPVHSPSLARNPSGVPAPHRSGRPCNPNLVMLPNNSNSLNWIYQPKTLVETPSPSHF